MSVVSRNPFDLLGDDGAEPTAPASTPAPPKSAPTPATQTKPAREIPGSQPPKPRGEAPQRGRGGSYYNRGAPRNVLKSDRNGNGPSPTSPEDATVVDPEQGFDGERKAPPFKGPRHHEPRGHGEGRGRGRATRTPRGRGGGYANSGSYGNGPQGGEKRVFDRRSGNAHVDSEKKVEKGWGADEGSAELAAEIEGAVDASQEAAAPETPAAAESEEAAEPSATPAEEGKEESAKPAAPAEEEEDKTKSYEEYLKEQADKALAAGLAKLNVREVDGAHDLVALKKGKEIEDDFFSGLVKKKEQITGEAAKSAPKKEKVFIEIEGRFAPPASSERGARGGRGGRGASRGSRGGPGGDRPFRGAARGGRGGYRASSQAAPGPKIDDASAFPALGAQAS